MASVTLTGLADRYAVGATVGAYPASGWLQSQLPPSGVPQGAATASGTIGSDGSVTLTGLADGTAYYLTETSGTRHYTSFATPVATASGTVSVTGGVDTELPSGLTGDATNGLDVDVTRVQGTVAVTAGAGSQADGHSASIGATADADTANTVIGRLKQLVTLFTARLPGALGSTGGLKVESTIAKAEDSASANGDLGLPILGVRNDNDATLVGSDGDYTALATDGAGRLKVASGGATGSTVPARALYIGGVNGAGNLQPVEVTTLGRLRVISTAAGAWTDRSGTITSGGTSQQVMAANVSRVYLFFQNVSSADLWIRFGSAAVADQPSIKIRPDASFVLEGSFVSTEALNVIGATTAQAFVAKEG